MRWEDFDEDDRTLRVVRSVDFVHKDLVIGETKTEDGKRTIYLPDSLWKLLAERRKKSFSEWIFPNLLKPELPLDPSKAYRQLKVILKKGGLPDIRLHDLRHTFTSHAANSGIAPKTLSEIVGHSKASFTLDHYAHVTSDMQKNAAHIVTNYITDILGKELKPWGRSGAPPVADEATDKEWQQQGEFRSGSEEGDYVATGKAQKGAV